MSKKLRPIMFVGTGSDVGKSVITAAFCRIFLQDGYAPAPFKAQNMALNSFATPDCLEIGRAQAVQAEAAGIACHTDMNPLLLKPSGDTVCQVVLHGKAIGNKHAIDYFTSNNKQKLRAEVCSAFDRLQQRYNPIVLEGAGSISEINLREVDLVNMPMAQHANAAVILVADIDRGGVFASVYGSILLLNEAERKLIKGILINKFRGDIRLFENGIRMIEELCKVPVVGVVPYFKDIKIEEEDSVMLHSKHRMSEKGKVNVAVVLLQHMSNFTDFDALENDPRLHLYYCNEPKDLEWADIVILPGTKNTLNDLLKLRNNGMAKAIGEAAKAGKTILGICGGYQMMGTEVCDAHGVEGDIKQLPGLAFFDMKTEMEGEKITRQINFDLFNGEKKLVGYEIHNGRTQIAENELFLNIFEDGKTEGCRKVNEFGTRFFGSYMHGILDNKSFIDMLIAPYAEKTETEFDYLAFKNEQYNKLAAHVRKHVDMNLIYNAINTETE